MSDQDNGQVSTLQRPTADDPEAWRTYWKAQGCPWRTEPEIDAKRQKYLAERRVIVPDIEKGIYPFKDVKLSRADVEWLLATHENGRGPVDWSDEIIQEREGLDMRGADLRQINLRRLPLVRLHGGLTGWERVKASVEQRAKAAVRLEGADLQETHLEGALLRWARLERANLRYIRLERADLREAFLMRVDLRAAILAGAYMGRITLADEKHVGPRLVDTQWSNVNLAVVKWSQLQMLGDEYEARQKRYDDGQTKDKATQLDQFEEAVRAYRQLAVVLQAQGLNEEAARFAYRAQLCQRIVLRRQRKFGQYLFSIFLDLLAGYGYRPGRSVIWYLVTIIGFALAYFAIGHLTFWPDAIVYSLTSFHGRGFLPSLDGQIVSLHYPLVVMAAFEAVVGLLIEISFIATFTQRFFGR